MHLLWRTEAAVVYVGPCVLCSPFFFFLMLLNYNWFTMLCLISAVQHRDYPSILSHSVSVMVIIGYWISFSYYTIDPCCLSITYIIIVSVSSKLPVLSLPPLPHDGNHKSALYICESVFVSYSFDYVEVGSFYSCFLESFDHKWMLNFVKGFLCIFFGTPKSLQMVIAAMKLKDAYSLEGKLWPT